MSLNLVRKSLSRCMFQSIRSCSKECNKSNDAKKTIEAMAKKFKLPDKYNNLTYNMWLDYAALAEKYNPIHLGQGFPDYLPPDWVLENFRKIGETDDYRMHQYARSFGSMNLANALAELYSKAIGRDINPAEEVHVSPGAYGSVNSIINAFLNEGDEVILVEPYFECYRGWVELAGGCCKNIALRLPSENLCDGPIPACLFTLDPDELKKAFNKKTKIFLLNNPHNPTGKIFTVDEVKEILELCEKWNVILLSDEVYEWGVYPGNEFVKTMCIPGAWERTIAVGSGGKKFLATGWKTGWSYGPRHLMKQVMETQIHTVNSFVTPIQEAFALNVRREIEHWDSPDAMRHYMGKLLHKNNKMVLKGLTKAGLRPVAADAGQYIMADWTEYAKKMDGWEDYPDDNNGKDFKFTKWFTANHKLLTVPVSAFYYDFKELGERFIRINILKGEEALRKGIEIFQAAGKCGDDESCD